MVEIVRKVPKPETIEIEKPKESPVSQKIQLKNEDESEPLVDSDLLKEMLKAIVSNPESIKIEEQIGTNGLIILKAYMDETDIPRVIGRQGKTIQAIQQFFQSVGASEERKISVQLANTVNKKQQVNRKRDRNYSIKQTSY